MRSTLPVPTPADAGQRASDDAIAFVHHALKEVEWIRKLASRLRWGQPDRGRLERDLECIAELSRSIAHEMRRFLNDVRSPTPAAEPSEAVPIDAIVAEALQRIRRRAARPTVRVHVDEAVRGSRAPRRLILALLAILENAIDFTDPGGSIRLEARPSGAAIAISVVDRGRGMEQRVLSACRARGFTTRPEAGGHGLGLYAASKIVERSGGALCIRSSPGGGTRVIMKVPREPGDAG